VDVIWLTGAMVIAAVSASAVTQLWVRARNAKEQRLQRETSGRLLDEMRQMATVIILHDASLQQTEAGLLQQPLEAVRTSALRLRDRLNDLAALTGLDGHTTWRKERRNLAEMVRLSVIRYLPEFEAAGASLHCDIADGPLWVHVAPAMLQRVLDRCMEQALGRAAEGPIQILVRQSGHFAMAEIQAGFPGAADRPEHLLARAVLERHGGGVEFERVDGASSCIRLRLPTVRIWK